MIMQKFDMEIIEFDAADVITTSSIVNPDPINPEPIDDAIKVIWLSKESISNYNAYSNTDNDLYNGFPYGSFLYYAYNGALSESYYTPSDYRNDSPDTSRLFFVNSSTDSVGYQRVLDWLVAHSGTHGN